MTLSLKQWIKSGFTTRQAELLKAATEGSGTSGAAFYASVFVGANWPSTYGAYAQLSIKATGSLQVLSAANVLQTVPAGAGNGFNVSVQAPGFSAGTCTLEVAQITVVNADGTQKLALNSPEAISLTSGQQITDLTGWTERERIGTDLVVSADHLSVDSTADGQFMAQIYADFHTVGLVP